MLRRGRISGLISQNCAISALSLQNPRLAHALIRQRRKASTTSVPLSTLKLSDHNAVLSKGKEKEEEEAVLKVAAREFESAGLNARLSLQLVSAFPSIRSPTPAQKALLAAISKDNDIILRAHTGTGKSFGLLLGLLNKPRLVVREAEEESKRDKRITSIIVVPSRELAMQYEGWAKQLFPKNMHHTLPSAVTVRYRDREMSVNDHLKQLAKTPPHVLVITATLLQDMLSTSKGPFVLGISTLRTLVYDEGDALLELPSRFPSQKLIWNHLQHPADGLQALNTIMKSRASFSGGLAIPSAGLERDHHLKNKDIRRRIHQGNDILEERRRGSKKQKFILSEPRELFRSERAIQLIVVSATANSVLRNFLGAKTGWLRTGLRDERSVEMGKWLDLTGLSKGVNKAEEVDGLETKHQSGWALQLPKELKHSCVVVDEPIGETEVVNWRVLNPALARQGRETEETYNQESRPKWGEVKSPVRTGPLIVAPTGSSLPSMDDHLLTCLAYIFASQPVNRALVLIPATWSIAKTKAFLAQLDVPVRYLNEAEPEAEEGDAGDEVLYLLQANTVRGIDVPGGISHVFCLGIDSVRDTTGYTHLAGRAARIGHDQRGGHERPPGHVITLVRGLSTDQALQNHKSGKIVVMASSELKMSLIYKRLDLKVEQLKMQLGEDQIEQDVQGDQLDAADVAAPSELVSK